MTLIVTAQVLDEHMAQRVAEHQERRPSQWQVIEETVFLAECIRNHGTDSNLILVDCLTLWLMNLIQHADQSLCKQQIDALLAELPQVSGKLLLINNEINLGVVPADSLSRRFCDQLGLLNQQIAKLAHRVEWVVAGLPMTLKK